MIILIELAVKCEANTTPRHYHFPALLWNRFRDFVWSWNMLFVYQQRSSDST